MTISILNKWELSRNISTYGSLIKLNIPAINLLALDLLNHLNKSDFDLSLSFVNKHEITKLNKRYRNKDKPTDVLSFPCFYSFPEQIKFLKEVDCKDLGDVFIYWQHGFCISSDFGKCNEAELIRFGNKRIPILITHSICHLLGYDHETEEDYKVMSGLEDKLAKLCDNFERIECLYMAP